MVTRAVSWLKIPGFRYFDDFGKLAVESTIEGAVDDFDISMVASAALKEILGFDSIEMCVRGAT